MSLMNWFSKVENELVDERIQWEYDYRQKTGALSPIEVLRYNAENNIFRNDNRGHRQLCDAVVQLFDELRKAKADRSL